MSSKIVYIVFAFLFLFMLSDVIFKFPLLVRAVFYISAFVIGGAIYYMNFYKPNSDKKEE